MKNIFLISLLARFLKISMLITWMALMLSKADALGADHASTPAIVLRSVMMNTVEKRYDSLRCFKPEENNFQFSYEGIDLSFSGQLLYRYRLKTGDEWRTTAEKTLLFPSLPAGKYTFEAAVKNKSSRWSEPVKFSFEIAAPLYQQWWFILSVLLIVAVATTLVVSARNKQLLKKQREQLMAQQRMNEMENQAKQAMMNPHFVFNALNSIQQYINENDRISANKYLTKFSRLIRLNLDLVNKNLISLEEELEKLKLYLEIEQLRFGEKLKYEFIVDDHLETDIIFIPSMILQPFVENSIWHGLMSTINGGTISIQLYSYDHETMLQVKIADDGIGIHRSQLLNRQQERKSFGTDLTLDRLKLFGKKYKRASEVTFTDLSDDNPNNHGTLVTLSIPLVFENQK